MLIASSYKEVASRYPDQVAEIIQQIQAGNTRAKVVSPSQFKWTIEFVIELPVPDMYRLTEDEFVEQVLRRTDAWLVAVKYRRWERRVPTSLASAKLEVYYRTWYQKYRGL